ncbi:hypothetical protein GALMADRAFT_223804 [Galerina marginata CBS 339.88]|uniref:Uncharacterized protein n=1 Tax=Galerina marginata (strain CBS 339.88) TaxID=685588 RepID=A0A067T7Z6_GALM3|nr:hypothetical protein GALMADRAFT_223804 [Galerina marginata CBS 339.88]
MSPNWALAWPSAYVLSSGTQALALYLYPSCLPIRDLIHARESVEIHDQKLSEWSHSCRGVILEDLTRLTHPVSYPRRA